MTHIVTFPTARTSLSDAAMNGAAWVEEAKLPELLGVERVRDLMQSVRAAATHFIPKSPAAMPPMATGIAIEHVRNFEDTLDDNTR